MNGQKPAVSCDGRASFLGGITLPEFLRPQEE